MEYSENLETYYAAKYMSVDAGVVVRNHVYDPTVPCSEELLITRMEQISSYGETKLEFECTKGGAGKRDRAIRVPFNDGKTAVTKSDKGALAACGRLGD